MQHTAVTVPAFINNVNVLIRHNLNTITDHNTFYDIIRPPQNLTYSLHEAGVVTTGGIDFILLAEHLSILGTPVGKCRL